ncbi:MAG: Methyltransferase type 12 [Solirubrobacteraceae bacterium]|nr:Methyltransferase type 12 [Solirubrobacteraceae bacterium]
MKALDYTAIYDPDTDFDAHFTRATGRRIARRLAPGQTVLELGCATGLMTTQLAGDGRAVVAVDRSPEYLARATDRRLPGVRLLDADIEDLDELGCFDHVVIANVLHEVGDPGRLLTRVRELHLAPGGQVHVSLQNPASLHRIVALEMGLLSSLTELSDRGTAFGTQRLFWADEVAALAATAGLAEIDREGVFLKPLANAQMAGLGADALAGFELAARHLPAHGAINLLVFGRAS